MTPDRDLWGAPNGDIIATHSAAACGGGTCCVHHPSPHHMRGWPLNFRFDTATTGPTGEVLVPAERMCRHGVGHPDPDAVAYLTQVTGETAWNVHGCDGCCQPPTEDHA